MSLANLKVAVLGATGYIGRSLVHSLSIASVDVTPVSRDISKAVSVFSEYNIVSPSAPINYDTFLNKGFDVVVNVAGMGSPSKLKDNPEAVLYITEEMDRLLFNYLNLHQEAQVFNISSGVVYGFSSGKIITKDSLAVFSPNNISSVNFYSLAKLTSEAKHRAKPGFNIIDLRVYSFFSQFVDSKDKFLMSEIVDSLENNMELETNGEDIVRDFCNADQLIDIMNFLLEHGKRNDVFDVISKQPITKFELLDLLCKTRGLKYIITNGDKSSVTGVKNTYCSDGERLKELGYKPTLDSLSIIEIELEKRLDR